MKKERDAKRIMRGKKPPHHLREDEEERGRALYLSNRRIKVRKKKENLVSFTKRGRGKEDFLSRKREEK